MSATQKSSKSDLKAIMSGTIALLIIPLVAMQFNAEVDWGLRDFVIMGILLFGAGFAIDQIARNARKQYQALYILLLVALFFLVWAELAVGVIGSPFAGN